MCMGWGAPAGAPVTVTATLVCLSPCLVRVAVPDSPELFEGASLPVEESAAGAGDAAARSSPAPTRTPRQRWIEIITYLLPSTACGATAEAPSPRGRAP